MENETVTHDVTICRTQLVDLLLSQKPQVLTSNKGIPITVVRASVLIINFDPNIGKDKYAVGFCRFEIQYRQYVGRMELTVKDENTYEGIVLYQEN